MGIWVENYYLCVVVSVILAGIIIPNIMTIAFRRRLFDEVDERKIHRGVVPRLGGISFLPAFVFSFCMIVGCNIRLGSPGFEQLLQEPLVPIFFLICALMLMYLVGIADDLIGVRYRAKFVFQIIAGILLLMSGSWIKDLHGFVGIWQIPTVVGWLLTVFLMLYVINAVNLIDGIDGLASGLSAIALIFYSYIFFKVGEYAYSFFAGATLGTLIPFFYYNVFGSAERHNKIFMGDTGSLTIGAVLAFLSIRVFDLRLDPLGLGENILVMAISPILIPCMDVARVYMHRKRRGKNPFLPDKCHIHHKLLALGYRQWQALITILMLDALFVGLNLILSPYMNPTFIIGIDFALFTFMNVMLTRMIRRKERIMQCTLYE